MIKPQISLTHFIESLAYLYWFKINDPKTKTRIEALPSLLSIISQIEGSQHIDIEKEFFRILEIVKENEKDYIDRY